MVWKQDKILFLMKKKEKDLFSKRKINSVTII